MRILLTALLFCFSGSLWADTLDIEYFSRSTQYTAVKLSPDGKHMAVQTTLEGKQVLMLLNVDAMKPTYIIRFGGKRQVGEFHWANNERVIFQLQEFKGWFEKPVNYGEWYAVNVDGKKQKNIFGYRAGEMQTGSRIQKQKSIQAWGEVVDLLPENDKEILMKGTPMDRKMDRLVTLYRLNIYNGKAKELGRSPTRNASFLTDHQGQVRFASGVDTQGNVELFYRSAESSDWQQVDYKEGDELAFSPVAFADKENIYAIDDEDGGIYGVYKINMVTSERRLIYRDEVADPSGFMFSSDERHLLALEVVPDRPAVIFLNQQHDEAQRLKNLMASFPEQEVRIASTSRDGSRSIVKVFSDTDPGQYYLYEAKNNSMRYLLGARSWVDPDQSAKVQPIEFAARDGRTIRGYLTLPIGVEAKQLPLVVIPHGGPHGLRDWWGYDPETQLLANRGMAILQVNFRGSGGYGREFERAGHRRWGAEIQYDIIDATHYVIEQGVADKNRICIYGASFGGYSALQSSLLEPDLFACSVGFVGIYDLEMLHKKGDIKSYALGRKYLDEVLGNDVEQLRAYSPINNLDKLKAPVLIIHGEEDERAPIEHAYALRDGLKANNHPYEWMVMGKEGHGFYNDDNRKLMYQELLGFLEKHLGVKASTLSIP